MTVEELIEKYDLEVVTGPELKKEIEGVYIGDLLSNVMAKAKKDNLWLTVQGHQNAAAVALLVEMSAVILVEGFEYDEEAVKKACKKGVNLLKSKKTSYELSCNFCESKI